MFNDQLREDLLITALEGGSNYWYLLAEEACGIFGSYPGPAGSEKVWQAIADGKTIPVNDAEEEEEVLGSINMESIKAGEEIMLKEYPHILADILKENWDAGTADVWFQLCVMKEVVFG